MYYQQNPFDEARSFFKRNTILSRLIIINMAVFVLVNIVNLVFWLFKIGFSPEGFPETSWATYWLAVPASLESLAFRPWTIITYMFFQENFLHLFFNMLVLYFGGRIFMEYLNSRKLLNVYLIGGLSGALFYIVAFNIFPVFSESLAHSLALGSSASVLAILVAAATFVPEYSVVLFLFGRVKLKYLALIIILVDLLSIQRGNAGGHIAHLGGAMWGFVYISLFQGKTMFLNFSKMNLSRYFRFFKGFTKKTKDDPFRSNSRPLTDEEYNSRRKQHQDRIDRILEKISKSGYDSLSSEEKELLFRSSSKNR